MGGMIVRFGVVAATVLLAVLAPARDGADRDGVPRVSVDEATYLQFNLCGNVCNGGGLAVVERLATVIEDRRPDAVTLKEVCENQFARLRADLDGYGGRFDPTGPICRGGARYGNAALLRTRDVSLVGSWALPDLGGSEPRRLMCLRGWPSGHGPLVACVTHISIDQADIGPQLGAFATVLNGLAGTGTEVVLSGDLNVDPLDERLNPLYAAPTFGEADSAGRASRSVRNWLDGADVINEDTFGQHKLDYVFLSAPGWASTTAQVVDGGLSDHRALWATLTHGRAATAADGQ
jgi:endonuclease/exonuclease/phosphatase family metal-dependent hydrolase